MINTHLHTFRGGRHARFWSGRSLALSVWALSVAPFVPTHAAPAPAPSEEVAQQIHTELDDAVDNGDIRIAVVPLTANRFLVTVTGQVDSEGQRQTVKNALTKAFGTLTKNGAAREFKFKDGLTLPPAPKDPEAQRRDALAQLITGRARRFFAPYGLSATVVPVDDTGATYQLKLAGTVGTVEDYRALFAANGRCALIIQKLNAGLTDKHVSLSKAYPVNVDAVSLSATGLISAAFKPLADKWGVTAKPRLRAAPHPRPTPTPAAPHLPAVGETAPERASYSVILSGTFDSLAELHDAEQAALGARDKANDELRQLSALTAPPLSLPGWALAKAGKAKERVVSTLDTRGLALKEVASSSRWPLSHLGNAGFADGDTKDSAVAVTCAALNKLYGDKAATPEANDILLQGSLPDIRRMKSLLAVADSSHPQVRLSFWSVQASGKSQTVADAMGAIQTDVDGTQWRVRRLQQVLNRATALALIGNGAARDVFVCRFYAQMFELSPWDARTELGNLAASTFQNPALRAYQTDTPDATPYETAANFKLRNYSNDECLILLGLLPDREMTQACLRFSLACERFEAVRALIAEAHGKNYRALDPNTFYNLALTEAARPSGSLDGPGKLPSFEQETVRQVVPITSSSPLIQQLGFVEFNRKSAHRMEEVARQLTEAIEAKLKTPSILGSSATAKPQARQHTSIVPTLSATAKAENCELTALQRENEQPIFPAICATLTPDYMLQGRASAQKLLTSLHDYYDLARALGLNTAPQGRFLRQPKSENAEFGDLPDGKPKDAPPSPTEREYYAAHYIVDSDGSPVDEDPPSTAQDLEYAPENLARAGDASDGFLESMIDALQSDIETMYFKPLQTRISEGEGSSLPKDGITFGARTQITVSNNQAASQVAKFSSAFQNSSPAPFTPKEVFGTEKVATTFGNAGLVNALFASDIQPTYAQIAPGTSVKVTPSTSLSGSDAELLIATSFGVPAPAPGATSAGVRQAAPLSSVLSDDIQTRISVNGFRLFQIASANVHTDVPQGNTGIPVLERIPLIGTIFQWPVSPKRTDHQSLLLVNAVIVPRALQLADFYGAFAARTHPDDLNRDSPLAALGTPQEVPPSVERGGQARIP